MSESSNNHTQHKLKSFISKISKGITLIGIACLAWWFLVSFDVINYTGETPLGFAQGFVVDSSGNIYVHTGIYGKILVYNSEGVYLRNWSVLSDGEIDVELTNDQNILVTQEKLRKQTLYNQFGKVLTRNTVDETYFKTHRPPEIFRSKNKDYEITGWFSPKIITTAPIIKIVVKQRWFFSILNFYFGYLFTIIGIGLRIYLKYSRH